MRKIRGFWWVVVALGLVLLLPFPVVSKLEEQDAFCVACHLAPEQTYVLRSQMALQEAGALMDLASDHYRVSETAFRCIDCHRGDDSPAHRFQTFTLGARDALIWLSGQADETIEKGTASDPALLEASCLKCHLKTLVELGFNNHYHNQLPQALLAEQAGLEPVEPPGGLSGDLFIRLGESNTTLTCLACHQAHVSIPDGELTLFMDVDNVLLPACEQCHRETGAGPQNLSGSGE